MMLLAVDLLPTYSLLGMAYIDFLLLILLLLQPISPRLSQACPTG
jgi:hypothetical protein